MSSWFGRKAPARVPTDTVVPLRYWDDNVALKSMVVFSLSRFDGAMDADKLHSTLERLASRKGWRKLGARLRKNAQGGLEYHLPAEFTPDRPAITYSHDHHEMPIKQHPLAGQLPEPSPRPAVVGDPVQFTPLAVPPGSPSSLDDYLYQDRGLLGLHVVTFTDATLVVLYFSHTTLDLMSWGAILTGWTAELDGRLDDIPVPLGGDPGDDNFDLMSELGTKPTEPHVLAAHHMPMSGLVGFGLRNSLDLAVRPKECRIVCIPGSFVDRLRAQALEELRDEAARNGATGPAPFLSHGDVLSAWWTRLTVSQLLSPESERTITIQNAVSARKILDPEFGSATTPYISNLFSLLYSLIPAKTLLSRPVSWLAAEIRRSITEQRTRPQAEAYWALQRQSPGRVMPFFGNAGMHLITLSNWSIANFYGHNFAAARLDPADQGKPLYPSYVQALQLPFSFPEGSLIIGKDQGGNYWMYGFRVKGLWAKVEEALAKIDMES